MRTNPRKKLYLLDKFVSCSLEMGAALNLFHLKECKFIPLKPAVTFRTVQASLFL